MKKLVKAVVCSQLLFAGFVSVMPVSAAQKETKYEVELKDENSLKEVFSDVFNKKVAKVKFSKKKKNTSIYTSDSYVVKVKNLEIDEEGVQSVSMHAEHKDSGMPISRKKNVTLKVADTTAPEITCEDSFTVDQNGSLDLASVVTTNEEAEISVDAVDTSVAGSKTYTITATDEAGNKSTKDVTVQVDNYYQKIADAALAQLGVNQDCTMLVTNSLKAVGIDFHGSPAAYLSLGELTNDPVPGDICVYQGHVAIYIGNGQAVHGGWLGCQTVVSTVECTNAFVGYVHVSK